jgi:hypothetical protein
MKRETKVYSDELVAKRIRELAKAHLFSIVGLKDPESKLRWLEDENSSWYFSYERSWGVGATIDLRLTIKNFSGSSTENVTYVTSEGSEHFDEAHITEVGFVVDLNWSSTGRDLIDAQASVALYQELINVGAMITSMIRSEFHTIGRVNPVSKS